MNKHCQNEQQHLYQNGPTDMMQVFEKVGAGEGNRTLVISLEGFQKNVTDQHELILFATENYSLRREVDTRLRN